MTIVELKATLTFGDIQQFLSELSVEALLVGDEFIIESISDGRDPANTSVCFLESLQNLKLKKNVLYIVSEKPATASCIVTDDPRYVFIKFLEMIEQSRRHYSLDYCNRGKGINARATVHSTAVIEDEVVIEEGAFISAGVVLKRGTVIKKDTIVRENTVIGCPGIALYKAKNGEVLRFPHLSGVVIGRNVEIGANSVIVKGTLKPTRIEDNVVIGNLCNIGHGAIVKSKVWMSVGTLVGGNCVVENASTIGLGVNVKDNLMIAENTSIGMGSVVTKSTDSGGSYFGNPAKLLRGLKAGPQR